MKKVMSWLDENVRCNGYFQQIVMNHIHLHADCLFSGADDPKLFPTRVLCRIKGKATISS